MYYIYIYIYDSVFFSFISFKQVKEIKDKAMAELSPYRVSGSTAHVHDVSMQGQQAAEAAPQPYISLLEFVSEIYQVSICWNHKLKCLSGRVCCTCVTRLLNSCQLGNIMYHLYDE